MTEDEMVGWHHQLDGHEFGQAPGVGEGQGSLMCCSPWGHKESDTTEQLNLTESTSMNLVIQLQDTNLIHKNMFHLYTLTMKDQKEKLNSLSSERITYLEINLPETAKDLYLKDANERNCR